MQRVQSRGEAYTRFQFRKPEGKRSLEGPRHRWEDIIKMDLQEVVSVEMDCIDLAKDRDSWWVVNVVMNFQIP